jgi:Bacterial pre-peptidase C-terminal domain
VAAAAAHDGPFGLQLGSTTEFMYRNDSTVRVQQGDVISYWAQANGSPTLGRLYLGFGASSAGSYSLVMAGNTSQFSFQRHVPYGNFTAIGNTVSQTWTANKWYRFEVTWAVGGTLTGRVYDSDGATLLNTVTAVDNSITSGGIAFRGFGPTYYVDTFSIIASEDWYSVNLTTTANSLRLDTSTPADGPNEFLNTLNPHIQLYDPSNTLVATGVPMADGRNEFIQYQPLVTGSYRVRVTGESSTAGEYFLGVTPLTAPAVTITVDNTSWGFSVHGTGWSLVNDASYGGSERTHVGVSSGTDFAQWQYSENVTAATPYAIYATWVPASGNASNATYKIFDGATLLTTVVVDQTRSPNTGLIGGSLVKQIYTYVPLTTGLHVIRIQLSDIANGTVVADAIFDPPLAVVEPAKSAAPATAGSVLPAQRQVPVVPSRDVALPPTPVWPSVAVPMSHAGFDLPATQPAFMVGSISAGPSATAVPFSADPMAEPWFLSDSPTHGSGRLSGDLLTRDLAFGATAVQQLAVDDQSAPDLDFMSVPVDLQTLDQVFRNSGNAKLGIVEPAISRRPTQA